jgi:protein-disulfide isomerase
MPRRDTASPTVPPTTPPPRRALAAALVVSLGGMALSGWLVRLHVRAHAGFVSFCALGEGWNCDTVALSPYSVVLGLPVAVWGLFGYAAAAVLAGMGLAHHRQREGWPSGLLFVVASLAVAACVALAFVSEFLIHSFCVMCAASWTTALFLLLASWAACRPAGVRAAVAADLKVVLERPALLGGAVVAALAVAGAAQAAYPRYWEKRSLSVVKAPSPSATTTARTTLPAPGSELVIQEFSDFECPFCALAHEDMKALAAARPGLRVVNRHFPLDSECNPALNRRMHEKACEYAKAAICAEGMGKGDEMADLLFADQKARRGLDAIVSELGLDRARFSACVASKETAERLGADVQEGLKLGLRATPSFVVKGQVYSGRVPEDVLR